MKRAPRHTVIWPVNIFQPRSIQSTKYWPQREIQAFYIDGNTINLLSPHCSKLIMLIVLHTSSTPFLRPTLLINSVRTVLFLSIADFVVSMQNSLIVFFLVMMHYSRCFHLCLNKFVFQLPRVWTSDRSARSFVLTLRAFGVGILLV